jgi:hypothetical protein
MLTPLCDRCHRKRSIQRCTAALSPSVTYIIPIITKSIERRVVSVWMLFKIGPDAGDRVRKVASLDVFERSPFAPSEMLVPMRFHCVSHVDDRRRWAEVSEIWPLKAQRGNGCNLSTPFRVAQ